MWLIYKLLLIIAHLRQYSNLRTPLLLNTIWHPRREVPQTSMDYFYDSFFCLLTLSYKCHLPRNLCIRTPACRSLMNTKINVLWWNFDQHMIFTKKCDVATWYGYSHLWIPWHNSLINRQNIPMPCCYIKFNFNHTGNQYYVSTEIWLRDVVSVFTDERQGRHLHMNFQTCYILKYQQFTRVVRNWKFFHLLCVRK
jgi:hypothetical protein